MLSGVQLGNYPDDYFMPGRFDSHILSDILMRCNQHDERLHINDSLPALLAICWTDTPYERKKEMMNTNTANSDMAKPIVPIKVWLAEKSP